MVLVLNMNKYLTLNFKDALLLLNVHFLIGPKKCRVSYQLLAFNWCFSFINLSLLDNAKDRHNGSKRSTYWKQKMPNYMNKDLTINLKDALYLLSVHFLIGPKKCRVSYQFLAFILIYSFIKCKRLTKDAELHEHI
jgi:hypothetical protein